MIFDEDLEERYALARERIISQDLHDISEGDFADYVSFIGKFFLDILRVVDVTSQDKKPDEVSDDQNQPEISDAPDVDKAIDFKALNEKLYRDILPENYDESYTNPDYCADRFAKYGKDTGRYLNWIATHARDTIAYAYEGDRYGVLLWMELYIELIGILQDGDAEGLNGSLHDLIYYFMHDYDDERMEKSIRELVVPDRTGLIYRLVMERDHSDPAYLYEYGDYISDNEIGLAEYLSHLSEKDIETMAGTYTEGYRKGFEIAGIDLDKKKTVEIRYPIGLERVIKKSVEQFAGMGLEPVFRRKINTASSGVISTPANKQYLHDHRFDDAIYLNQAFVSERLKHMKSAFENYRDEAYGYAGPASTVTFGERLFVPANKVNAPTYTDEQEKISLAFRCDQALLQDEYIPGDKRSYTVIAYPIPEIGEHFREIFAETVGLNTLDSDRYHQLQQALIDTLDTGKYVRVRGCGDNKTDMKVMLHPIEDPREQTIFENCVADVNIPVGEVFTSPVLTGTEGVLHVSHVYLDGLPYKDLEITFKDGMITDYTCKNYDDEEQNKAYIKENVLYNHDTLPIGEFAIGTNTTAYVMWRRYGIEDRLHILIAEKTGPHFAVGDTCYSMCEDVKVYNPDGKEIIARDNECSIKRLEHPEEAYFQCHTDITIPFEELGSISVFTKDEKETIILRDGRFVLPGTEELNIPLDEWDDECRAKQG